MSNALEMTRGMTAQDGATGHMLMRSAETASTVLAEGQKAEVQARFMVAMHRPRSIDQSRTAILDTCRRPRFAEKARYAKPVGKGRVEGLSIRAADEFARIFMNLHVGQIVTFDDDEQRIIKVVCTDLETNLTKEQQVVVRKTVERRNPKKGAEVVGQRQNSYGDTVYIVKATDDELLNKEAALCAKARRNLELQLIPSDILEEAEEMIISTRRNRDAEDPDAARKRLIDCFASIGIKPDRLEKYLGHDLSIIDADEIEDLRNIFAGINAGEGSWRDFTESEGESKPKGASEEVTAKVAQVEEAKEDPKTLVVDMIKGDCESASNPTEAMRAIFEQFTGKKTMKGFTPAQYAELWGKIGPDGTEREGYVNCLGALGLEPKEVAQ